MIVTHRTDAPAAKLRTWYSETLHALRLSITAGARSTIYTVQQHGAAAVDLAKDDGEVHEIRRQGNYLSCTCKDFQFTRAPYGCKCKHIVAVVKLGLLPLQAKESEGTYYPVVVTDRR